MGTSTSVLTGSLPPVLFLQLESAHIHSIVHSGLMQSEPPIKNVKKSGMIRLQLSLLSIFRSFLGAIYLAELFSQVVVGGSIPVATAILI